MFLKNKMRKQEDETTQKKKKERAKKAKRERQPRKRSEVYVMRKNTVMRIMRISLWTMLLFIFVQGVRVCIQKDSTEQAQAIIRDFRREFSDYKDDNEEIMGFAQNFAREYLTYEKRQESDYARRIMPYVSKEIYGRAGDLMNFAGKTMAIYVKAYRKESYAEDQYDVYVLSAVEYEREVTSEKDGETETDTILQTQSITLKIPIYSDRGRYVVEGIPVIVNDRIGIENYSAPAYSGTTIIDSRVDAVREAVTSFLTAYYEQDQNVIEYYLTKDADRAKFQGLSGTYRFGSLESMNCYDTDSGILCLVEFTVTDVESGSELLQSLNVSVTADGDKYYIKDMNTKTGHL